MTAGLETIFAFHPSFQTHPRFSVCNLFYLSHPDLPVSSLSLPHVLAVPAVLSLSRVSLGCILHCPNSPKFHDFCCCPNSAQLNPTCSFYQQCVYCPFQGMNVAYKPHGTRCLPVPPHPIPPWHSSCCSSSAPALKLRLWSCPTPTQGSVHLEMPLCLLIHSGALILLPPSGLPLPSAACPRLPLLSFWAVMV